MARYGSLNSSRVYLEQFVQRASTSVAEGAWVLDAGAGDCIYKGYFKHTNYESADFCQVDKRYGDITYACDLSSIPVEDAKYDLVLMTQVLEHLAEPQLVLQEIRRILKPSGRLWLSVPLFYEEHEAPYDFYRYTQYGLTHMLDGAGFTVREMFWLEGYYGTLSHQLRTAAKALPTRSSEYGGGVIGVAAAICSAALRPFFAISSIAFAHLDLRRKYVSGGLCKNYVVVASKKT